MVSYIVGCTSAVLVNCGQMSLESSSGVAHTVLLIWCIRSIVISKRVKRFRKHPSEDCSVS